MSQLQTLLYPALVGAAHLVSPFSPKVRDAIRGRKGLAARVAAITAGWSSPVWFHVASSGELEQALPVMDAIKRRRPETRIFLSYFSPTARRGIELETERRVAAGLPAPWDASDFGPYDFSGSVGAFLDALEPRAFVAIHREIWPTLLSECRRRGIPRYLFATYLPPGRASLVAWYRDSLKEFDLIGATGEETARLLRERLGAEGPDVRVMGDPRVERVLRRKEMRPEPEWARAFADQTVVVLASLWPKDFAAIAPALEQVLATLPGVRLVLVPHEPRGEFPAKLASWLTDRGLPARRWSVWQADTDRESHLVVDGVGFLAELYRVATAVFVGGSFQARVHNVLEPAAYAKPVFTGPYIENSGEAREMWEKGILSRVDDAGALARELLLLLEDPDAQAEHARRLSDYITARAGAAEAYADVLAPLLG